MAVPAAYPGEHLAEELKELGMSAAELARQLDVPTNRSNRPSSEHLENRLRLLTAFSRGEKAIQKGQTLTHAEAKQRLKRWLE